MGVFDLVTLALLATATFAGPAPEQSIVEDENDGFLFGGKKWVVLVAGSSGWNNYRHQADICHAYQIARRNGIPEENIITMMVDDIVNNPRNPTPGKIVNKPNGTDVYEGVVIDYKGSDVTSANFLEILTGNEEAMRSIGTGKVVKGGRHDRVFINYVDHGSTGVLCFPNDFLYADQLDNALSIMYSKAMYGKALLYIEACRAGSMFDGILSENTNVLAVTAAGPRESSYGCYCRSQSGPYGTCLGDLFSVTWMEELDTTISESFERKRTIFNDFRVVRTNVTNSNVMIYGDFDVGQSKLSEFIGYRHNGQKSTAEPTSSSTKRRMTMSSRDVQMNTERHRLEDEKLSPAERRRLEEEISRNDKMRHIIDTVFRKIYLAVVKSRPGIENEVGTIDEPNHLDLSLDVFPCYRNILNKISDSCFSLPRNPYTLDRLTFFANLCVVDNSIHETVSQIVDVACSNVPKHINNVY